jgi:hypothetical protein
MYTPKFPYSGNQIIITSGRVTLHSKEDAVFIFGKQNIGLSSVGEIHLDALGEVTIDAPRITLGHKDSPAGSGVQGLEPIALGYKTNQIFIRLTNVLIEVGTQLSRVSETNLPASMQALAGVGESLKSVAQSLNNEVTNGGDPLNAFNLSKTTYTK